MQRRVRNHTEAKASLRECQAIEELLEKYSDNCRDKHQIVTAYKDAIFCFDNSGNQLVLIDFKNKLLRVANSGLAKFKGFETARYQEHDDLITELVTDFNKNKKSYCDGTDQQAGRIPNLDPKLIKAWLIQETGGNDQTSLAAWKVDPGQVNVPGDWSEYKADVGLTKNQRGAMREH